MKNLNEIIGANVRRYRIQNKLSQKKLGKMLHSTNLSVHNWESGITLPSAIFLKGMSEVFGCSIDDLFRSTENEP